MTSGKPTPGKQYPTLGQFKTPEAFRDHLRSVAPELDCALDLEDAAGPLGQPVTALGRTIGNRFVVHPMEGWDGNEDGTPSAHTLRRWRRFGLSGAKLIWGGEAFAVQEDGRANPNQLYLNPRADVAGGLRALIAELRGGHEEQNEDPDELVIGLQLTHSGRFSKPRGTQLAPKIATHHPVLDAKFGIDESSPVLADAELEAIADRYLDAAALAHNVGFHFVDVKCCHGYLLHELLGAQGRDGDYGGSFQNRTRLFERIASGIRSRTPELGIAVRVSIADVFPYAANPDTGTGEPRGWEPLVPFRHGFGIDANDPRRFDLTESFRFLSLLESLDIDLVNITLGSPYYCPHLQRPATFPPSDGYQPPEDPLASVARHITVTRQCKAAFPNLVLVGTGYSYLQQFLPHVAQHEVATGGTDLVGLGRMILSYPELPLDVLRNRPFQRKKVCRTFSDCTTAPRNGMVSGCFPLDPYYKDLPEAERLREIKKSLRS